jgi:hypothetical protein
VIAKILADILLVDSSGVHPSCNRSKPGQEFKPDFDIGAKSQQHPNTVVGMVCHAGCVHSNLKILVLNYHVTMRLKNS